jgi:antitoxin (DNA-binding transcriptional repressor) of toxin-antitoxin stability system
MTKIVNIHQAKTHLSRLIEEALAGEDIVIAKAGKAKVRLEVVREARVGDRFAALFGSLKTELAPLADARWFPTPEDELEEMLKGHENDPLRHLHHDLAAGGDA